MGSVYLDCSGLEVRRDGEALAVYVNGVRGTVIPFKLIDRLVLRGRQARLETDVILALADRGAAIVIQAARAPQRIAHVLGPAHNDAAIRLAQGAAVRDAAYCHAFARSVVTAKLRRQGRLLRDLLDARPDPRKPLFAAAAAVRAAVEAAQRTEVTSVLRGVEGAAARAYFQGYAAVLPPAAGFHGRNRRPPRDPVNVCLSLAYTLLHADAVRAAHAAGLDPLLGFYHRPAFGRESLASDLVEPLRSLADRWVWHQWREGILRPAQFSQKDGICLMHKSGREAFYPAWEAAAAPARRWLRLSCARLANGLRASGLPLLEDPHEEEPGE